MLYGMFFKWKLQNICTGWSFETMSVEVNAVDLNM